jgi:hypothetical protein
MPAREHRCRWTEAGEGLRRRLLGRPAPAGSRTEAGRPDAAEFAVAGHNQGGGTDAGAIAQRGAAGDVARWPGSGQHPAAAAPDPSGGRPRAGGAAGRAGLRRRSGRLPAPALHPAGGRCCRSPANWAGAAQLRWQAQQVGDRRRSIEREQVDQPGSNPRPAWPRPPSGSVRRSTVPAAPGTAHRRARPLPPSWPPVAHHRGPAGSVLDGSRCGTCRTRGCKNRRTPSFASPPRTRAGLTCTCTRGAPRSSPARSSATRTWASSRRSGQVLTRVQVGDRVSVPFNIACGTCRKTNGSQRVVPAVDEDEDRFFEVTDDRNSAARHRPAAG